MNVLWTKRLPGRFFWLLTLILLQVGCAPTPAPGRLIAEKPLTDSVLNERAVWVWLPPGYDQNPERHYKVLYMHDGQNLFDSSAAYGGLSWNAHKTAEHLILKGEIEPFILVGVANSPNRFREYAPQKPLETVPDSLRLTLRPQMSDGALLADRYVSVLCSQLIPHIDRTYRTQANPEGRAMAGSSMGGLISLYSVCERPDVFGSAACLSTHWPIRLDTNSFVFRKAFEPYLYTHLGQAGGPKPRLYFDRGSTTLDRFYAPHQNAIDSCFKAWNYPAERWQSLVFEGSAHNEAAWAARFDGVLRFLFGMDELNP